MAALDVVLAEIGQALAAYLAGAGITATLFTGWPTAEDLHDALRDGRLQISIFPRGGMNVAIPRNLDGWASVPAEPATMTATVQANETDVLIAGTGLAGQIAAVAADGMSWTAPATGTAADTASALAALIAADRPAVAIAGMLQLSAPVVGLDARVATARGERRVLGDDQQGVQISVWAPSVALRDSASAAVDIWARRTQFLDLPNDEQARLVYDGKMTSDDARQSRLHRRDVMVTVTYSASETLVHPATVVFDAPITSLT